MPNKLIKSLEIRYEEYLRDESKMSGQATSISFPETIEEVATIAKEMRDSRTPITVQGGKTGICGGAVPIKGHVLNLTSMNKILGLSKTEVGYSIKVQAGLLMSELEKQLYKKSFDTSVWDDQSIHDLEKLKLDFGYFWPLQPTETSATIGGILATNAGGICGYLYGDTVQYVEEISLINSDGVELTIPRGKYRVDNNQCVLPSGEILIVDTDVLKLPADVDLIDLYIGSEGMYGIIVSATLRLIERPSEMWGIGFFFEKQDNLFKFAEELRGTDYSESEGAIAAIEYIDKVTLDNIQKLKKVSTKLNGLPDVDNAYVGMIYIEIHGKNERAIESIAEKLMELATEYDSDEDSTWALSGQEEIEKIRAFRHAAPESINAEIDSTRQLDNRIMKLSTDITISGRGFGEMVTMYQNDARDSGIEIAIFGHVADNHVHVNFLPVNYEEYVMGKRLIEKWVINLSIQGAIIFSENGVGKMKRDLFLIVADREVLKSISNIKNVLDPNNILNPGNVLDENNIYEIIPKLINKLGS